MRRLAAVALAGASLVPLAAGDLAASAAGTATKVSENRIVLSSNRDGKPRAYAIEPDGKQLTPLLPPARALEPVSVSRDGRAVAYRNSRNVIYVSRANGTHLHRVVQGGDAREVDELARFSPNRKLLAFQGGASYGSGISIVHADGRGRRTVTRCICWSPDWSPDSRRIVYAYWDGENRYAIIVQPLHGKRRTLVRIHTDVADGVDAPAWSPRGTWIAYRELASYGSYDLYLVRPNGTQRHRLARDVGPFTWSHDGARLAFVASGDVGIVGVNGKRMGLLHIGPQPSALSWSADGSQFALAIRTGEDPAQIWSVGVDGSSLHRLTNAGENGLVGWTPLAPVQRPAADVPPTERIVGPATLETLAPIKNLSADGPRVAFIPKSTTADCEHVAIWTLADNALQRFRLPGPCGWSAYGVELAGSRAAWMSNSESTYVLKSATLTEPTPEVFAQSDGVKPDYHVHGDGDLLVFSGGSRLVRIGTGSEKCLGGMCTTIRRGEHADPVASVSGRLIAIREHDAVAVVDDQGSLVRVLPFAGGVTVALLDGGRLVVSRSGGIESYDVATGGLGLSRRLPADYRLVDVDDGIAVLLSANTLMLLRLEDGRSLTLAPGGGPMLGDLESPGLYYAYPVGKGSRIVFLSRSEIFRQLG